MSDLYLCAILARDEPTFVVAEKMEISGEDAFIISFGGWRVYPYWSVLLSREGQSAFIPDMPQEAPADWPDSVWKDGHDKVQATLDKAEARKPNQLLLDLGLIKEQPPMRRI